MTQRKKVFVGVLGILLLSGGVLLLAIPHGPDLKIRGRGMEIRLRLGLDLLGGTQLLYRADMSGVKEADRADALQGVRDVIERRVNPFGVAERTVQATSGDRMIVELPGVQNAEDAIRVIGETPQLDFREEAPPPETPADVPRDQETARPPEWNLTKLTGRHLKRADVSFHPQTNAPEISLVFDGDGAKLFAELTEKNIGKRIAIFLDGIPITAPVVQDRITEGKAVITGTFTIAEAKKLTARLRAGALPVPVALESRTTVGPSLGKESLGKSMVAGAVGIVFIMVYMVVLYRLPGVVASFALFLYGALNLVAFKLLGVTMTLPGIMGFILSVGMAVDANILIFERLKEELWRGRFLQPALTDAFREAWNSIRDSNVSSLITCLLLYTLGSSIVRGFALTLGIGILLSMFSAIIVTRTLLRAVSGTRMFSQPAWYVDQGVKTRDEGQRS